MHAACWCVLLFRTSPGDISMRCEPISRILFCFFSVLSFYSLFFMEADMVYVMLLCHSNDNIGITVTGLTVSSKYYSMFNSNFFSLFCWWKRWDFCGEEHIVQWNVSEGWGKKSQFNFSARDIIKSMMLELLFSYANTIYIVSSEWTLAYST